MNSSLSIVGASTKTSHIKSKRDERIIEQAIVILEKRIFSDGPALEKPDDVSNYLRIKLAQEPNEVFMVVFLDAQHQVIACEALFRGTIDASGVYPRVIVKRALEHNAAALILAHNHPSGCTKPSIEDQRITSRIQSALALVDIRVLDHFIIGKGDPYSFAQQDLL